MISAQVSSFEFQECLAISNRLPQLDPDNDHGWFQLALKDWNRRYPMFSYIIPACKKRFIVGSRCQVGVVDACAWRKRTRFLSGCRHGGTGGDCPGRMLPTTAFGLGKHHKTRLPGEGWRAIDTWGFPKIGVPQSSSILMGFSLINHFGVPPFMETPTLGLLEPKSSFLSQKMRVPWADPNGAKRMGNLEILTD